MPLGKGNGNSISPVSARCSHGAFPTMLSATQDHMSVYCSDMTSLPDEYPEVHEFMRNGGFSVQLSSDNSFGRIPVVQTLEETVNKDTQTPRGTKGFSL